MWFTRDTPGRLFLQPAGVTPTRHPIVTSWLIAIRSVVVILCPSLLFWPIVC
jgi:hypothetical protein